MTDNLDSLLELRSPENQQGASSEKFPALRFIARLNQFFAVLTLPIGVILLFLWFGLEPASSARIIALLSLFPCLILTCVTLWGSGEFLFLLLDIEKNTRLRK